MYIKYEYTFSEHDVNEIRKFTVHTQILFFMYTHVNNHHLLNGWNGKKTKQANEKMKEKLTTLTVAANKMGKK